MKHNNDPNNLMTFSDAVETLTALAEMEVGMEGEVFWKEAPTASRNGLVEKTIASLTAKDFPDMIKVVKRICRVIYQHLQSYDQEPSEEDTEQIKSLMVVLGQAAKKLDRFSEIFQTAKKFRVSNLREYQQLKEYYFQSVAFESDEDEMGKWLLNVTKEMLVRKKEKIPEIKVSPLQHLVIDLEAVKSDTEYELIYLHKDDGTPFFSSQLLRNIKVVCDFGVGIGKTMGEDPLVDLQIWKDRTAQSVAKELWKGLGALKDRFLSLAKGQDNEWALLFYNGLISLALASQPHHLKHNEDLKSCEGYFRDFLSFVGQVLRHRDFQRERGSESPLSQTIFGAINHLCQVLICRLRGLKDCSRYIDQMIESAIMLHTDPAEHKESTCINLLKRDWEAMTKATAAIINAPLHKLLRELNEGDYQGFTPLLQDNLPNVLFSLKLPYGWVDVVRLPSPTSQETLEKASIIDEFKQYLKVAAQEHAHQKDFLFNFQDRTAWREFARASAVEGLAKEGNIEVMTLARETDFYLQNPPYHQDHQVDLFFDHLFEHFSDQKSGYFESFDNFPWQPFLKNTVAFIHQNFFHNKNVLALEQRKQFIDLVDLFVQLKALDVRQPNRVFLSCKDGIDTSPAAAAALLFVIHAISREKGHGKREFHSQLRMLLFGYPLIGRERLMLPERFQRAFNIIKTLETCEAELGKEAFNEQLDVFFGENFSLPWRDLEWK